MPTPDESKLLNINTVFLAVLLALSGWTLNKVSILSEQMSAVTERHTSYSRELLEIRARVAATELKLQELQLQYAKKE